MPVNLNVNSVKANLLPRGRLEGDLQSWNVCEKLYWSRWIFYTGIENSRPGESKQHNERGQTSVGKDRE
jgi:hypothetical protein